VLGGLPKDSPANIWVKFVDAGETLSRRHFAVLGPALRQASADPRIVAVSCTQHARPKSDVEEVSAVPMDSVEGLLSSGNAELAAEELEGSLGDLVVRAQTLRSFMESTPSSVLAHSLCAHRLRCRLASSFGKKVQRLPAPEGEWMRWVHLGAVSPASCSTALAADEADVSRGDVLYKSISTKATGAAPPTAEADDAGQVDSGPLAPGSLARTRLSSPERAAAELASVRRRIEKSLVLRAGEKLTRKELRDTAHELMHAFLQEVGLGEVIGIERWARETSEDLAVRAAKEFAIQVADE